MLHCRDELNKLQQFTNRLVFLHYNCKYFCRYFVTYLPMNFYFKFIVKQENKNVAYCFKVICIQHFTENSKNIENRNNIEI